MNYYNFDELNAAADISILQRISNNPKTITSKGERELHDCCPFGGPADNTGFWIWLDRQPMEWSCRRKGECPGCPGRGDAMQFIAMREKLNRKQDAQRIAEILAAEIGATPSTPCNVSGTRAAATLQKKEAPRSLTPPPLQWQKVAGDIVNAAADMLHNPMIPDAVEALEYLHGRGITDKMIDRYRIGYIPIVEKYFSYPVNLADGKRMYRKAAAGETFIRVPEGITIPTYINGQLFRVKVRKLNRRAKDKALAEDVRKPDEAPHNEHDYRYSYISGGIGTALFNADAAADKQPRHDIIFVEGELDALLINSIAHDQEGDTLQAVTFGSANSKPPYEQYYRYFRTPERIVIAFDNDDSGKAGAAWLQSEIMNLKTRETPPIIATVPDGYKDFGEYYAAGGNVYELLCKWFPLDDLKI